MVICRWFCERQAWLLNCVTAPLRFTCPDMLLQTTKGKRRQRYRSRKKRRRAQLETHIFPPGPTEWTLIQENEEVQGALNPHVTGTGRGRDGFRTFNPRQHRAVNFSGVINSCKNKKAILFEQVINGVIHTSVCMYIHDSLLHSSRCTKITVHYMWIQCLTAFLHTVYHHVLTILYRNKRSLQNNPAPVASNYRLSYYKHLFSFIFGYWSTDPRILHKLYHWCIKLYTPLFN